MLGIIKDDDVTRFEFSPIGYKIGFNVKMNNRTFGEYGIRFSKYGIFVHVGHTIYNGFFDFVKSIFSRNKKRKGK